MTVLTYDVVREELERIVAKEPDAIRPGEYTSFGEPYCIVGTWLVDCHGVSVEDLADYEGQDAEYVVRHLGIEVTKKAERLLGRTQDLQDSHRTWEESLKGSTADLQDWDEYR